MPEEVDNCVKSVLEDNPDYSEARAYAICWAQENEGNLSADTAEELADFAESNNLAPECANKVLAGKELDEDDPCWEGYTMVGMKEQNGREVPNCVPDDDVPDAEMSDECPEGQTKVNGECVPVEDVGQLGPSLSAAHFTLSELETEPIEREELSENEVVYRNVKILQSGTWTDSGSRETIWYSPRGLDNLEVRENNAINIMHDSDNEVSEVGHLENPRAESGELYADLRINTDKAAGEYADDNLKQTLETNGAKGFGGPSVEIDAEGQEIEYNESRGVKELTKGLISGLGLVKNPASKPTAFARQTANRGVALSEGQNHYHLQANSRHMADIEEIRETLDSAGLGEVIDDMSDEEVMDMAENLHGDLMDDLEPEEDMENAEHGDKEDEEEDEEEEMDMEADQMLEEMQALKQRVGVLEDEIEQMEYAAPEDTEQLSEELESTKEELADAETVQELQDAKEELDKRLSELEDKPDNQSRKTLAGDAELNGGSESGGHVAFIEDPDPY